MTANTERYNELGAYPLLNSVLPRRLCGLLTSSAGSSTRVLLSSLGYKLYAPKL